MSVKINWSSTSYSPPLNIKDWIDASICLNEGGWMALPKTIPGSENKGSGDFWSI